ncbi:MAG TPA: hypothetical protein VF201_13195 [Nitrolancea sp.]
MSDQDGDHHVDSADATNGTRDQDEIAKEEYPLSFRSLVFWLIVVALGLLGTCVFVAIFLALTRGS